MSMQVTLKDITLSYDHHHNIFDHLSLVVQPGELIALLGPSGSGKTTILNLLAGLLTPTAGQILFADQDVTNQDVRSRNIGMVFQDYALYPYMTVLDNIAFPLKMAHVNKANRYQRARELATLVHVDDQLTKLPGELSGGQQQRVAIARALAKDPAILLLDEPLSNLDATLRIELRDEIRRIQRATGVTTIFVTHDQSDALRIADKIIVLADGQLQQVGTGPELYHQPRNLFVAQFIGTPRINTVSVQSLLPYITSLVPATILNRATTAGIRSEALLLHGPADDNQVVAILPVTVVKQDQFGRELQTAVTLQNVNLISTSILNHVTTAQKISVSVTASGFYLFDQTGNCIWAGDRHD